MDCSNKKLEGDDGVVEAHNCRDAVAYCHQLQWPAPEAPTLLLKNFPFSFLSVGY
jgi:hypothetical protein